MAKKLFPAKQSGDGITAARLGQVGALLLLTKSITFTREYDFNEFIELMDLPANARVVQVHIPAFPSGEVAQSFSATIGTTANQDKFGNYTAGLGMETVGKLYMLKEDADTKLIAKIQDPFNGSTQTELATGVTLDIAIVYVQES
jgi:hypothetical protein